MSKLIGALFLLILLPLEGRAHTYMIQESHNEVYFNLTEIDNMITTQQVKVKDEFNLGILLEMGIRLSADTTFTHFLMNGRDLVPQMEKTELQTLFKKCLRSETAECQLIHPESCKLVLYTSVFQGLFQNNFYVKYNDTYTIKARVEEDLYEITIEVNLNRLFPIFRQTVPVEPLPLGRRVKYSFDSGWPN